MFMRSPTKLITKMFIYCLMLDLLVKFERVKNILWMYRLNIELDIPFVSDLG